MTFWERVEAEIGKAKTTQEWVAGKVGTRPDSFSRWKKKGILPDASEAVAIAHALGATVEYLVTGSDASDPWLREHAAFLAEAPMKPETPQPHKISPRGHSLIGTNRVPQGFLVV
jgi:transcriptional regulator with XRE-family HTH domain